MVQPNPGVTIETWALVKDDASIEYLVSCDGDGVEFSFGQTGWTTGLSINITAQGLRRCVETFTSALSDLDARNAAIAARDEASAASTEDAEDASRGTFRSTGGRLGD